MTLGGIDIRDLSSKTMEARDVPGFYAIGEAVDVTGWLGGYNFQWAWSSGWCAGQVVFVGERWAGGVERSERTMAVSMRGNSHLIICKKQKARGDL